MKTRKSMVLSTDDLSALDNTAAELLQEVREWEYFLNQSGIESPSQQIARQLLREKEHRLARVLLEKLRCAHYH